jgi:hypothetical protein
MSRVLTALLFAALAFAYPALAQDKAGKERVQKVLLDNSKVRVTETTFKPGDVSPAIERPYRVTRVIKGGETVRTYADGKSEKWVWKTDEVRAVGPDKPYSSKNVGKSDVVLYTVILKQASGMSKVAMASDKKPQTAATDPKKPSVNVLLENDAVRVYEASIPAGTEGANVARPYRVGRSLTDATLERIYPDGKKEALNWKAGEVRELGPNTPYIPRNVGKTDFRIFVVEPKSAL